MEAVLSITVERRGGATRGGGSGGASRPEVRASGPTLRRMAGYVWNSGRELPGPGHRRLEAVDLGDASTAEVLDDPGSIAAPLAPLADLQPGLRDGDAGAGGGSQLLPGHVLDKARVEAAHPRPGGHLEELTRRPPEAVAPAVDGPPAGGALGGALVGALGVAARQFLVRHRQALVLDGSAGHVHLGGGGGGRHAQQRDGGTVAHHLLEGVIEVGGGRQGAIRSPLRADAVHGHGARLRPQRRDAVAVRVLLIHDELAARGLLLACRFPSLLPPGPEP